jgi:hypothetical protein
MTDAEILRDIQTKPTIPIWPHLGFAYGCSRGSAYKLAENGSPGEFIRVGRLIRATTAPLRKRLRIEAA